MVRFSPGPTVVVLGAGATRGASFVDSRKNPCLPPLNADFFTQLQRIRTAKHKVDVDAVVDHVVELYGPNFNLTLEDYFTQLEAMGSVRSLAATSRTTYSKSRIAAMRRSLMSAVSAVLEESADVVKANSRASRHPCSFHGALAAALNPKDTILSFNYDCVMDDALRRCAAGNWSAQYGYGFPNPARVRGHEAWSAENPPTGLNRSINLFKMHGSLNWFRFPTTTNGLIRLRQKPYKQVGDKDYEIIPPERVKNISGTYEAIWKRAGTAIRHAQVLAFVGFSFTPTDLHVDSFFRIAIDENVGDLRRVVIANPSAEHRSRVRGIVGRALLRRIPVVQFDSFAELAAHLPGVLEL